MDGTKIFYSAREVAAITGMDRRIIQEWCNARGQKFAFKNKKSLNSKWRINLEKFMEYLERKTGA